MPIKDVNFAYMKNIIFLQGYRAWGWAGVVGARRRLLSEEACYDLLLRFFFGEAKGHKLD